MPQGDTDKNDKYKGHQKGQICNGTISQNKCHKEYILRGEFHAFFKKYTPFGLCRPTNKFDIRIMHYGHRALGSSNGLQL